MSPTDRPEIDLLDGRWYGHGVHDKYDWIRRNEPVCYDDLHVDAHTIRYRATGAGGCCNPRLSTRRGRAGWGVACTS